MPLTDTKTFQILKVLRDAKIEGLWVINNTTGEQWSIVPSGQTPTANPNDSLTIQVQAFNRGDRQDTIWSRIVNVDTGAILSSGSRTCLVGEYVLLQPTVTMGTVNLNFRVEAGYGNLPTSIAGISISAGAAALPSIPAISLIIPVVSAFTILWLVNRKTFKFKF